MSPTPTATPQPSPTPAPTPEPWHICQDQPDPDGFTNSDRPILIPEHGDLKHLFPTKTHHQQRTFDLCNGKELILTAQKAEAPHRQNNNQISGYGKGKRVITCDSIGHNLSSANNHDYTRDEYGRSNHDGTYTIGGKMRITPPSQGFEIAIKVCYSGN